MSDVAPEMLASVVSQHGQAAYRELAGDEGAVLLQLESGGYHGLNRMGCLIWELIARAPTLGELIADARERVADPPDTFAAEIASFIDDLRTRELVVVTPPA